MTYQIRVAKGFVEGLKSLPPHRQKGAKKSLVLFQAEPALPRFRFRALAGQEDHYIISVNGGDRIILRKEGDTILIALDVGPHDNVYRRWDRK